MIPHWGIIQPYPSAAERILHRGVTARDRVCDLTRNLVQRNLVNTKPPYEVFNVAYMFLVRFRGQ